MPQTVAYNCVGCRPSQEKRLFLEEKHARRKRQLEGKVARVREAGKAHARKT
jgi:hypothetical protein